MHPVLKILVDVMERDIRCQCDRRYQALVRQYNYLVETKNEHLIFTYSKGWVSEKYKVLFALNTFFQIVIGPLSSSTRGVSGVGVGSSIPISYGTIKFNKARNKAVNKAYSDFIIFVHECGMDEWWLNLNQASDITYQVAKKLRDNEQHK